MAWHGRYFVPHLSPYLISLASLTHSLTMLTALTVLTALTTLTPPHLASPFTLAFTLHQSRGGRYSNPYRLYYNRTAFMAYYYTLEDRPSQAEPRSHESARVFRGQGRKGRVREERNCSVWRLLQPVHRRFHNHSSVCRVQVKRVELSRKTRDKAAYLLAR
ncbi:hypothetical protein LZ31DRAFT_576832 [Colletotrichum somersetense]|nr:hypothetical protein LZ31DRAFT_576832 [Colletotrichum somersetense]